MNKDHLQQIIDNYISQFEELNGPVHKEYYKWRILKRSRLMMDEALAAPDEEFSAKLNAVKNSPRILLTAIRSLLTDLLSSRRKSRLLSVQCSEICCRQPMPI